MENTNPTDVAFIQMDAGQLERILTVSNRSLIANYDTAMADYIDHGRQGAAPIPPILTVVDSKKIVDLVDAFVTKSADAKGMSKSGEIDLTSAVSYAQYVPPAEAPVDTDIKNSVGDLIVNDSSNRRVMKPSFQTQNIPMGTVVTNALGTFKLVRLSPFNPQGVWEPK